MKYQGYIKQAETSLFEIMSTLDQNKKKVVYIINPENQLVGSITDGDIRRYALRHHSFDGVAGDVMKFPCYFGCNKIEAQKLLQLHSLSSVPIINHMHHIIDIVFDEPIISNQLLPDEYASITVVMMAGGRGERLYPYTAVLPKPLIPIGGIPIAQRILERFATIGLRNIVLSLNYKKNIIKAYFDEAMDELNFTYIEEVEPMGTAGSLSEMKSILLDDFFVINCDMLIDIDLEEFIRYHKESGNGISVVSSLKAISIPYGVFVLGEHGEVVQLHEKPTINQFINTGMYLVNPSMLEYLPEHQLFHMTDFMQLCMDQGKKVGAYIINDTAFMDMGQIDELNHMQQKLHPK